MPAFWRSRAMKGRCLCVSDRVESVIISKHLLNNQLKPDGDNKDGEFCHDHGLQMEQPASRTSYKPCHSHRPSTSDQRTRAINFKFLILKLKIDEFHEKVISAKVNPFHRGWLNVFSICLHSTCFQWCFGTSSLHQELLQFWPYWVYSYLFTLLTKHFIQPCGNIEFSPAQKFESKYYLIS